MIAFRNSSQNKENKVKPIFINLSIVALINTSNLDSMHAQLGMFTDSIIFDTFAHRLISLPGNESTEETCLRLFV